MTPDASGGLRDLTDAVRRRWRAGLLVALAMTAGVFVYAERLPNAYDGVAVVAFAPQPDVTIGADTIRVVVPKYVAYLTSRATARTVAREYDDQDEDDLLAAIDVGVAPETANVTITVRMADPTRAAAVANRLAREAVLLSTVDHLLRGQVIAPALPASEPASPPRRLIEAGGLLLALLAGLTAAVLLDRSRPRITDALSAAVVSGHGVVGRIPKSRATREPLLALTDPEVGTAIRAIRTQLEQQARDNPVGVLAVTSSLAGEGKTTVASSLAGAFARIDAKVLLVDADLHRPQLAEVLDLDDTEPGLAEILLGRAQLSDVTQKVELPGLEVVVATPHADAGDLLARRLGGFLEQARLSYDVVVLDCPPLLSTDDARTLALAADATVLVVARGTEAARVAEAAAGLDNLRVRVLGTVLNRARKGRREGFGSYGAYRVG